MGTIPYDLMMLAVVFGLLWLLWVLPLKKSRLWAVLAPIGCGVVGLLAAGLFAKIFNSNMGQCICHGVCWHGAIFLIACAAILVIRKRILLALIPAFFGIVAFTLGFYSMIYEPYALQVENYVIHSPKIKRPLRIVFVADIQTDNIGQYEHDTLRIMMEQKPHLIIFGGDYLQLYMGGLPGEMEELGKRFRALLQSSNLHAPLGMYAVWGNVDPIKPDEGTSSPGADENIFNGTGIKIFINTKVLKDIGKDSSEDFGTIDLSLLEMVNSFAYGKYNKKCPPSDNYHIMVGHSPAFMVVNSENLKDSPDLMLAGHTHGGQVNLPSFIRSFFERIFATSETKLPPEWGKSGFYTIGDNKWLLITRGSGIERGWAPRIRFMCPPEISVIDILPE
ncbi:MAG: metallophosphoesterase [Planctomycetaceae bacterium]|jgi:predicted MPP superfamily phosphohydrolase|nr:metallophosphoesterase [Planctomycetaceae bacterium]